MRIHVVGGGPSGLYFALLMKRQDPSHDIHVFERNAPDATFGWGVVFSRRTLEVLREADPASCDDLLRAARQWEDVVVAVRDEVLRIGGNHFVGIERLALLQSLQRSCQTAGVELHFHHEFDPHGAEGNCDLLVAADGVNSRLREHHAEVFQPTLEFARNRYIWLGTPQLFHGLTLTFRPVDDQLFIAHSYEFSPDLSTFIVECDETTFDSAGLDEEPDAATLQRLAEVFERDLEGKELLSNHSRWIRFLLVKNDHWHHDNVVLLGDACHTAHFSVGSGTKLAMEDSIALAETFADEPTVARALPEYERRRKPFVDDFQVSARASLTWFEEARHKMHLDPLPFAMDLMTRSNRLQLDRLRKRDPEFVAAYEQYMEAAGGA